MSKMSHDRVHFTVSERYLKREAYIDCLVEVFGLDRSHLLVLANRDKDLQVICRPSQFARFIILRHVKYGEANNMACLNMQLVVPQPETFDVQDVSKHPNTVSKGCP
jgi:hypothetical protein